MRVRRRLTSLGAVPVKNSVYALPATDAAREDFEWLLREIVADGGEATLCEAVFIDGQTDARLRAAFDLERSAVYTEIREAAERARGDSGAGAALRELAARLEAAKARDHFGAPGRADAEHALSILELELSSDHEEDEMRPEGPPIDRVAGATWVTRRGARVDRISSAWLIRRFIDPAAEIRFVEPTGYRPAAGELRFDMFEGEYTHEGDRCTFETLVLRFGLADPALAAIAEIVHDLDLKEDRFGRAETAGVASMIHGIAAATEDDGHRIRQGAELFDALYAHFAAGA
ncbi:MAG TPA: chromate resistance protein ChrB domain-containing protein [Gemmatimonadota bacterium]